jgi:hypothetical protein
MKISVITATWNCVETVGDCLASVAGQSYPDLEHILIDGGSRDGTLDVLQAHRDRLAVLVSEPDGGIYDALNKGLARATGEVVGLLHADDVYADAEVLARVAGAFADPAVEAVYGDLVYVAREDTGRVIRYWRSGTFRPARLRRGWMPPHPTGGAGAHARGRGEQPLAGEDPAEVPGGLSGAAGEPGRRAGGAGVEESLQAAAVFRRECGNPLPHWRGGWRHFELVPGAFGARVGNGLPTYGRVP